MFITQSVLRWSAFANFAIVPVLSKPPQRFIFANRTIASAEKFVAEIILRISVTNGPNPYSGGGTGGGAKRAYGDSDFATDVCEDVGALDKFAPKEFPPRGRAEQPVQSVSVVSSSNPNPIDRMTTS